MELKGNNRAKGRKGERAAVRYLKKHGYKILKKNYRNPFGEVDIIAARDGVVAFIEVKARSDDMFGTPSEAVSFDRIRRYVKAAKFYFSGKDIDCTIRFDVVEVTPLGVNHIISAFEGF